MLHQQRLSLENIKQTQNETVDLKDILEIHIEEPIQQQTQIFKAIELLFEY